MTRQTTKKFGAALDKLTKTKILSPRATPPTRRQVSNFLLTSSQQSGGGVAACCQRLKVECRNFYKSPEVQSNCEHSLLACVYTSNNLLLAGSMKSPKEIGRNFMRFFHVEQHTVFAFPPLLEVRKCNRCLLVLF